MTSGGLQPRQRREILFFGHTSRDFLCPKIAFLRLDWLKHCIFEDHLEKIFGQTLGGASGGLVRLIRPARLSASWMPG